MKRSVGRSTQDRLEENLTRAIVLYLRMQEQGASSDELTMQRGVMRGCAMQVLSWCNPLYHGSKIMVAEVERIFVRKVLEDRTTKGNRTRCT